MSLIFLIRANECPADRLSWIKFDTKRRITLEQGETKASELEELKQLTQGCLVLFLIPGQGVRALDIELPGKKRGLLKSLPYLVEEYLAEPIEELHIAAGNEFAGKLEVLALSHEQMQYWQQMIDDSGINVRYLFPEYQLLQREDNSLWFDQMRAVISTVQLQGNLSDAGAEYFLKQYQEQKPLKLISDNFPPSVKKLLHEDKIIQTHPEQSLIQYLAENFSLKKPPANLLSGPYQATNPLKRYWCTFKRPVAAVVCLAALGFGQIVLDNVKMQRQIDQIDQQMIALYKDAFPQSRKVPDPVRQMRAKLNQQGSSDSQVLLPWLAEAAPLIKKNQIELINFRFDQEKNTLRLQLTAPDFNQMEQLHAALQSKGLESQLGTLVKNKDSVSGLLTLGGR